MANNKQQPKIFQYTGPAVDLSILKSIMKGRLTELTEYFNLCKQTDLPLI